MTTATFPRRRARTATAAAGLTAAIVLTACGGGGAGDFGGDSSATPAPSASERAGTGGADGGSGTSGSRGELEGSWVSTADGKAVALIVTGDRAAVFESGGAVCSGTAGEETGMRMIRLKCTIGSGDRTDGMVDSVDAESLMVTWEGGAGEETFQRVEGGSLPSGLPSEVSSGLP